MDIIIRTATINDVGQIAKIKIEGWQTAYKGIIDNDFLDNMNLNEEIKKRKNNIENGVDIIVAELNNEIVGFCLYRNYIKEPENYHNANCELSALYVKSSLKRKGIGSKLMKYVIQKLKNQGKTQMILGCLKENSPSRTFYEKMGGKIIKIENSKIGNKEYEEVIYEYDISNM
ncbi:MAG: GNAT family N-acetyltransferase [Clostridia bacterium]|nr:GNAT family N-acetyltransferase [Clostridia bacterium]